MRKKEILLVTTCRELRDIMPSEIRQTKTNTALPVKGNRQKPSKQNNPEWNGGYQTLGNSGKERCCLRVHTCN